MSRILMNHKVSGDVHDGYITVGALRDHLLAAQKGMSTFLTGARQTSPVLIG